MRIGVRQGRESDLAFVTDSWVKHDRTWRHRPLRDATALVRHRLSRSDLRIAHLHDDEDAIVGWAVLSAHTPARLHYVYVRREARRQGIATALLGDLRDVPIIYDRCPPADVPVPLRWSLQLP